MTARPFHAWSVISKPQDQTSNTSLTLAMPVPLLFSYYELDSDRGEARGRRTEGPCRTPTNHKQSRHGNGKQNKFCYSDSRELFQRCWSLSPTSNRSDLHECRKLTRRTLEAFAHHSNNSVVRRCLECLPHPVSFRRRPGSEQTPCNSSRPFSSSSASARVDEAKDSNAFLASSVCVGIIEEERWNHTCMGVERTNRL